MITITTNFDEVIAGLTAKLNMLDGQRICMAMAMGVIEPMRKRIHQDGIDADSNQIGTYSEGYMKVRTGNYSNKDSKSRSGYFTKRGVLSDIETHRVVKYEKSKPKERKRPNYNRDADNKVVASLTRQMENAMAVIPLVNGAGIGYHDELSYNKSKWVEETYGKEDKIFALSADERALVRQIAEDETAKILGN